MITQYTFDRSALEALIVAKVKSKMANDEILEFKWDGPQVTATVKLKADFPAFV